MTKKDIVDKIVQKTGLKYLDVKKVVQMTFDTMVDALTSGDKIELRNFGVFKVKIRKAKKGRNPRTGEEVPVPERKVVVFKPGLELKEKVK
jgi:DNA-binding protein HU-beta/integration host factor subunit beta